MQTALAANEISMDVAVGTASSEQDGNFTLITSRIRRFFSVSNIVLFYFKLTLARITLNTQVHRVKPQASDAPLM